MIYSRSPEQSRSPPDRVKPRNLEDYGIDSNPLIGFRFFSGFYSTCCHSDIVLIVYVFLARFKFISRAVLYVPSYQTPFLSQAGPTTRPQLQGSPGLPGRNGVNGHNGLPGRDGRDGTKTEKGVAGSSPGPRGVKEESEASGKDTDHGNWKQCVWRSGDGRDFGLLKLWWICRLYIHFYSQLNKLCYSTVDLPWARSS